MSLQGDCSDTETWKDSRGIAKLGEVSIVKRIKDVTSGLFLMLCF